MAFTRFHDDEARIIKQLQQQPEQERTNTTGLAILDSLSVTNNSFLLL
jgi:hypothetical protein